MPFAGILFTIFTIFSIIIFKKDEEYGGATMFAGVTITLLYRVSGGFPLYSFIHANRIPCYSKRSSN